LAELWGERDVLQISTELGIPTLITYYQVRGSWELLWELHNMGDRISEVQVAIDLPEVIAS